MKIIPSYQMNVCGMNSKINQQQLQTNPNFNGKTKVIQTILPTAMLTAASVFAMFGIKNAEKEGIDVNETKYGQVIYIPAKVDGTKSKLIFIRKSGVNGDVLKEIPQEKLQAPVLDFVKQANSSTINKTVGIPLIQNQSNPVTARKVIIDGTLENTLTENNMKNVPALFDNNENSMYIDTPWNPGRQFITGECFMVTYGNATLDWGILEDYWNKYKDENGEAPDVAILAAQDGTEDRSFMPANIAAKQYEIVTTDADGNEGRTPCIYSEMNAGVDYKISKKAGVVLKMAVPLVDVISSEGEVLKAGTLLMVDSEGHFYNGNPIKRILSGEVTWNADMNDPVQVQIRKYLDEIPVLQKKAKNVKKEAAKLDEQVKALREQANKKVDAKTLAKKVNAKTLADARKNSKRVLALRQEANRLARMSAELKAQSDTLNTQAKALTNKASQEMTEWVKSAQNPEGAEFFAE